MNDRNDNLSRAVVAAAMAARWLTQAQLQTRPEDRAALIRAAEEDLSAALERIRAPTDSEARTP